MKQRAITGRIIVLAHLVGAACDSTPLASAKGRHVIIHWDPGERQLCGGTLAYIDESLEVVAANYGVDLPAVRAIEIFWTEDATLAQSVCGSFAPGCSVPLPNGTSFLASPSPIDPHELAHTVRLTGTNLTLPSFFHEGVAVRWETGWSNVRAGNDTYSGNISYSWLLENLRGGRLDFDAYSEAGFFWSWLEAEHGADRMGRFASQLGPLASIGEIERIFEQTFSFSLQQATEASKGQPLYMFDIHACDMDELPVVHWSEGALTLGSGPSNCSDNDVVNIVATTVSRSVRLKLDGVLSKYAITVDGAGPSGVRLDACTDTARPYEYAPFYSAPTTAAPIYLQGEYIVTTLARIEADGSIYFPEVQLEQL